MCARAAWQELWLAQGAVLGGPMQSREALPEAQFPFFRIRRRPPKFCPWVLCARDRAQCRPLPSIGLRSHQTEMSLGFRLRAPGLLRREAARRYLVSHRFLGVLARIFPH